VRVLLACPGLDHAHRGFESFARECFDALRGEGGLEISLIKGSGPAATGERSIPTLRRDAAGARLVARLTGRPSFVVEHVSFSASLGPLIAQRRPDVVYFSEWHVGRALALWRRIARGRFRLVLCNGTSSPGPYGHLDLVQQLSPGARDWVLERGADPERTVLLPLGCRIDRDFAPVSDAERTSLRGRLDLPAGRRVLISVAALNRQKRIDHLIEELAAVPEPRPFLLVVGQAEEETPALRQLAVARLGHGGHSIRTVPRDQVADLLRASDVFVLASLWENLPRALIEAMAQGLPCIAHTHQAMTYVLGDDGDTGDLERPGVLCKLIARADRGEPSVERAAARHDRVYERFSWDALRPRYLELFQRAVDLP
jgi:1,2-diacylglycerol 3-alpha-glucosyltransferase